MDRFPGHEEINLVNAYRHCLGACLLTTVLKGDTDLAYEVEECHEAGNPDDDPDTVADRNNNRIGNSIGAEGGSCVFGCEKAMADGRLIIDR
jgi:hypothetical protein